MKLFLFYYLFMKRKKTYNYKNNKNNYQKNGRWLESTTKLVGI